MGPLRLGIVGTGIFARDDHLPVIQAHPDKLQAVAAYNRTKSKAESFAQIAGITNEHIHDSLDELLNDPQVQAVDALLPVQYNYDTVVKSVKAGKPIMIEKPIGSSLEDSRKIVQLAESTEVAVMISENWLHFKAISLVKERLSKIGDVVSFSFNHIGCFNKENKYWNTNWRNNPEHIGGFLSDAGVHEIALLTSILGKVKTVSAFTRQIREESGAVDTLHSILKLENGVIGNFNQGLAFGNTKSENTLMIYGSEGSIHIDLTLPRQTKTITTYLNNKDVPEIYEYNEDPTGGISSEFLNFQKAVTEHDKSLLIGTPRTTFHHFAFYLAAIESARSGGIPTHIAQP